MLIVLSLMLNNDELNEMIWMYFDMWCKKNNKQTILVNNT